MSEPIYIYEIPIVPHDFFWGWQTLYTMEENFEMVCFNANYQAAKTAREAFIALKNTFYCYLNKNDIETVDKIHNGSKSYATALLGAWYVIGVSYNVRGALLGSYNHIDAVISEIFPLLKYTKLEIKSETKIISVKTVEIINEDTPWTLH